MTTRVSTGQTAGPASAAAAQTAQRFADQPAQIVEPWIVRRQRTGRAHDVERIDQPAQLSAPRLVFWPASAPPDPYAIAGADS
jgi:hypothetical protein